MHTGMHYKIPEEALRKQFMGELALVPWQDANVRGMQANGSGNEVAPCHLQLCTTWGPLT